MIFLTKEILQDNNKFTTIIEKEKTLVNSMLKPQERLREIILSSMQNFAVSTQVENNYCANTVLKFLEDLKNCLNLSNENISLLNKLYKLLDTIIIRFDKKNININFENLNNFNTAFFNINETISKNTLQIEDFFYCILPFSQLIFSDVNENNITQPELNNIDDINTADINIQTPDTTDEKVTQNTDNINTVENTLIISEIKGKIFLPYTLCELNNMLNNNPNKYASIEDIINKEFTFPFETFKNSAISRFREAFQLMRKKEKKSIKDAFDLGIELFFNYNLHPAIIAACKNANELDIYLDYLENNETEKFDCFKIIFEIAPILKKK